MRPLTFAHDVPRVAAVLATLLLVSAGSLSAQNRSQEPTRTVDSSICDADNGGIRLPRGFCAKVIVQGPASFRHIVVAPNGDIFVGSQGGETGGLYALRDANGDGEFEVLERLWDRSGNGVALRGEHLYFATNDAVLRFRVPAGSLRPAGAPDTIVYGLPATQSHTAKSIALGSGDELYVNIGSPGNVCQPTRESQMGQDPCTELDTRAGIWRFSTERLRQQQQDGVRFATGIRNAVALTTHPETSELYAVVHGRDNLWQAWPQYFNEATSAELPAEEFIHVTQGDDFGWPYCFYDRFQDLKVLAPEYGGDGRQTGRCAGKKDPLVGFPGHWGPNGIVFYDGEQFPERYHGAAFIAFHGSWNRAPLPQAGYNVAVQRITEEGIALGWEIFADEFQGAGTRPSGVTVGPDGSLYITADSGQRIWRVRYVGTEPADGN